MNKNSIKEWEESDKANVWHPFTQSHQCIDNIIIEWGEGACLFDLDGNSYIDGISSWWVNTHGHCNKYIANAVIRQISKLEHSIFAGFTHRAGIELAERLLHHLPGFGKVFFSDNGSTAVEVAIKMALQYWWNKGNPKHKVIAFKDAYHGDTFGSMSVAARNAFNKPFEKLLFDVVFLDLPTSENIDRIQRQLEEILSENNIACFIFEPLLLGASGMLMYEARHLQILLHLCQRNECITIADEVLTGFGRTGKLFAIDHLSIKPDIICLSKGITGGFFPLGATICRQFIFDAFQSDDKLKTFFHGHSYTGNPLACSAAIANLDLMEHPKTLNSINLITDSHIKFREQIKTFRSIENIRQIGTILAFNILNNERTDYLNSISEPVAKFFIERNIILRPLGNVVYILPPYCISKFELDWVYDAIIELLCNLESQLI